MPLAVEESRSGPYAEAMSSDDVRNEQRARLVRALARAGEGREDSLREIYELTSAKLYGICLRILGDAQEAEDALQEVYVSVWRRASSFDAGRASPITWLATLARNRAIDRLRSIRRAAPTEPPEAAAQVPDPGPSALIGLEATEDRARLTGCIGELEARSADAIRSAFFGGFTYAELAEKAGVPLGTMKSIVRRALMKLKDCLER
jgi:RNA polymerase sigma-70 factor (ECF subfamily)